MKKRFICASLLLAAWGAAKAPAQISLVNPIPQQVNLQNGNLLDAPKTWVVKADAARLNGFAVKALQQSGIATDSKAAFTLTLGVKGDKAVKKYAARIPAHAQGYLLEITPKGAVIAGADEAGLFYGVQTLLGSIAKGKMECATITDWPDVAFRGTVEGFYGTPWSHKARLS